MLTARAAHHNSPPPSRPLSRRRLLTGLAIALAILPPLTWITSARAADDLAARMKPVLEAYAATLSHVDGNDLVWRDGTRMPVSRHASGRNHDAVLADADLIDMTAEPYPAGSIRQPAPGSDPGRARPTAFFDKMYGDCSKGEVTPRLVAVPWPGPQGTSRIRVTKTNGVADHLTKVSAALAKLPAADRVDLLPPAGGYNCRAIAGTDNRSPHGWGIAVDIAIHRADYWQWAGHRTGKMPPWRNRISPRVIAIFEANGFIWGGRWSHFDTMHFEYRPELLPAAR